jgi:hypothetical protein
MRMADKSSLFVASVLDDVKQRRPELLEQATGQPITGGKKYELIHCPYHNDLSPSCMVHRDGTWWCFVCGIGGDVLDWIGFQQFGKGYTKRGEQLAHVVGLIAEQGITPITDEERQQRIQATIEQQEADRVSIIETRQRLWLQAYQSHQNLLSNSDRLDPLYSWGFTDQVIAAHKIGWDGSRYTIPNFFRNVCFGIKKRLPPEVNPTPNNPKYNSETGSKWGMYGADVLHNNPHLPHIVITEDEKSAVALRAKGVAAFSSNGGAGFWGSGKCFWWLYLLAGVPEITFWRNADEADLPDWEPSKLYGAGEMVVAPNSPEIWVCTINLTRPTDPPQYAPDVWKKGDNAGLECARDFKTLIPRAVVVDSNPYKDPADYLAAGYDWRDVVMN